MFRNIIESKTVLNDSIHYNISQEFGNGSIRTYHIMNGVELTYNDFEIYKPLNEKFRLSIDSLEINYCLEGCLESELPNSNIVYMGDGDISIFGYNSGIVLADFTTKRYRGITIMLYLDESLKSIAKVLDISQNEMQKIMNYAFDSNTCIVNHGSNLLDDLFKSIYEVPQKYKNQIIRLKVVEIIMYLLSEEDFKTREKKYFPRLFVDKIKDARRILIENLEEYITIKELSQKVGLNSTDLQKGFKEIYQSSIYAYLKSCRMKKSKELILKENINISDIANMVGYSNSSKFSKAFKNEFGISPSEFKKSCK